MVARKYTHDRAVEIAWERAFEPLEPYGGGICARWRCRCTVPSCRRVSTPSLEGMLQGLRCRYCSAKRRAYLRRRRSEVHVREVFDIENLDIVGEYRGVSTKLHCRCRGCGADVHPVPAALLANHNGANARNGIKRWGCKHCSLKDRSQRRRVPETMADAISRAQGLEPLAPYENRHAPRLHYCTVCHQKPSPRLGNLMRGNGCRYCTGHAVTEETARARMITAGVEPLVPFTSVKTPWESRCLLETCGRIVTPALNNVARHSPCLHGQHWTGVEHSDSVTTYLIRHRRLGALKVGIKHDGSTRIADYEKYGWELVTSWTGNPYRVARLAELTVLSDWEAQGIRGYVSKEEMPPKLGGWTETAPLHAVDLGYVVELIELMLT